jgi:hypothetical protein
LWSFSIPYKHAKSQHEINFIVGCRKMTIFYFLEIEKCDTRFTFCVAHSTHYFQLVVYTFIVYIFWFFSNFLWNLKASFLFFFIKKRITSARWTKYPLQFKKLRTQYKQPLTNTHLHSSFWKTPTHTVHYEHLR